MNDRINKLEEEETIDLADREQMKIEKACLFPPFEAIKQFSEALFETEQTHRSLSDVYK